MGVARGDREQLGRLELLGDHLASVRRRCGRCRSSRRQEDDEPSRIAKPVEITPKTPAARSPSAK